MTTHRHHTACATRAKQLPRPVTAEQMAVAQRMIAEAAVVADIECEGVRLEPSDSQRVYDVRPMFDERERCPITIDMAAIALAYAQWHGLIEVLARDAAGQPSTVRILRDPA